MFQWIKELFDIRHEARERRIRLEQELLTQKSVCNSCEILRDALIQSNLEKNKLLEKLLNQNSENEAKINDNEPKVIMPRRVPWAVRQQLLEQEDRVKAQRMRESPKPNIDELNELEKEMNIASTMRELSGMDKELEIRETTMKRGKENANK